MRNERLKKIVLAGMFAAITCVATMVIKIPTNANGGYANLGDIAVILSGWMIGPGYGFAAAAIGSALADIFLGSPIYAPATFVIKGVMALVAYWLLHGLNKFLPSLPSQIITAVVAEIIMSVGYFIYDGILFSFPAAIAESFTGFIQPACGIVGSVLVYNAVHAGVAAAQHKKA